MNNYFRRLAAGAAAVMLLSSAAVFADEAVTAANPEVETVAVISVNAPAEKISVKSEAINGVKMVPFRIIAEHFNYTVGWEDATRTVSLIKDAKFVTFSIGTDAYTVSKMAAVPLGAAPVLYNDSTTYVPVNFFTEFLGLNCREVEDGISVTEPRIVELTGIKEDGSLVVADDFHGEVVVHIGENTAITANGEAVSADRLEIGQLLSVEYADFMTMSIPAQTTGVGIEILNLPVEID